MKRFMDKVDKSADCWEWTAAKFKAGYGAFSLEGKPQYAHRVSYELFVSEIRDGLHCLHKCDNPSCVNPKHLFLGTNQDNIADRMSKGRSRSKITEKEVVEIRHKAGTYTHKELAKEYNISRRQINDIINRKSWEHVK